MATRRDVLKLGLLAGGSGLLGARQALAQHRELVKFLCPPDDRPRQINDQPPSPPARPWVSELFVPPAMVPVAGLNPPPHPRAHQRYEESRPGVFCEIQERESLWQFHRAPPYASRSW